MRRFEREVIDKELIDEMMKMFDTAYLGLNDDQYPYVVPINFGYEITNEKLNIYIHCAKQGHKVDLINQDNHATVTFSAFNDFPDTPYKGHRHDYRSVIAKGTVKLVTYKEDQELFTKGYNLLYTCNNREIVPLESRKVVPPIYCGIISCDLKDVTAKSEFPLRTKEDVPFKDVTTLEDDQTPFDIKDIIADRKSRMKK